MTTKSGVRGKTIEQLRRSHEAARRDSERAFRQDAEQLALLDTRPGASAAERARLAGNQTTTIQK